MLIKILTKYYILLPITYFIGSNLQGEYEQ